MKKILLVMMTMLTLTGCGKMPVEQNLTIDNKVIYEDVIHEDVITYEENVITYEDVIKGF